MYATVLAHGGIQEFEQMLKVSLQSLAVTVCERYLAVTVCECYLAVTVCERYLAVTVCERYLASNSV